MKKWIIFLLSLVMCIGLAGCASEPAASAETVPQTTAPALREIEITLDNWQDYFELREAQRISVGSNGVVTNREFGYGVFLKEEYAEKLAEADVSFEMQVDAVRYQVYGDVTTENYIIRKDTLQNEGQKVLAESVQDFGADEKIGVDTDLYNAVAAYFTLTDEFGC